MNKDALFAQLVSIRATIDAAIHILASEDEQQQPPKCEHKDRMNLTTMGGPEHWICKNPDCKYEFIGQE